MSESMSAAPPPVEGLHREVEVMFDGKRRITYYSRPGESPRGDDEAAAAPAGGQTP